MASTIRLDQLLARYRSERDRYPAEPPLDTAARVLGWAGERLEGRDVRELVTWARSTFAHDGIPRGDRTALLAVGLVERERVHGHRAHPAPARRTLRDLTRAEYSASQTTDTTSWSALLIWAGGWIPVAIVAIVAGIVVAVISGDWRHLLTALGGTIVGYVVAIGAITTYLELDTRWLRLGQQERAAWVILLTVGPAVALLVAVLVHCY